MAYLECTVTKERYPAGELRYQSNTGALLDLAFEARFDLNRIAKRKPGMWRYREALPLDDDRFIVSADEGSTALTQMVFDGKKVFIKQEHLFQSGSYKDRGAAMLISKANENGVKKVVQDSSGNAGSAIAMYAAMAGMACDIYVPEDTAAAKIAQMIAYGATVHRVAGSREDTAAATLAHAQHTYYASHCYNPFFFHGTKTFAYEICEQLGWKAPDSVVVPAGNGTLVIGCYIGFSDLLRAGIIGHMPKIIAIQSAQCAPLAEAFKNESSTVAQVISLPTVAEGIAIAKPVRGAQILEAVRSTKGDVIAANEEQIHDALKLCVGMGYFIEPTSAATIAGLREYIKTNSDEVIVSLFSGHGLKAADKIMTMLSH